ncbi:MAG: ATP-binding protein [Mycoplasmataceae bacterium]|nr:ATP-binding protein [Mycoplasmataceae bacterium]
MVQRTYYLDKLIKLKDLDFIKILTGMRRVGKSTILLQYIEMIKKITNPNNILYINFDDKENLHIKNNKILGEIIDKKIKNKKGKIYLFLDEIQNVENFSELILGYYQNKTIDIYIAGSNSKLLSSQIYSRFTGREIQINILPFSFKEYVEYFKNISDKKLLFSEYRKNGCLPSLYQLGDDSLKESSITYIIQTILLKDIMPYFKIKNIPLLNKILAYAFENIGSEFSSENIKKSLAKDSSLNIASKTIDLYLSYLCDAFLIYKVNRFDLRGMKVLKTLYTCYATDILMRNVYINKDESYNHGKQLENIVFFELKRRFNKINVGFVSIVEDGKRVNYQIDFFCQNKMEKVYFQVCEDISDFSVLHREIKILKKINNGQKILLNNSNINKEIDEIKIMDVKKWLLEQ